MLLRSRKAQTIFPEYVLVFFVVIAMITAMTVYFQRSIQGRIRDAREYAVSEIRARAKPYYPGVNEALLYREYEPYYVQATSNVLMRSDDTTKLLATPGYSSGIFAQIYNQETRIQTFSNTAAPKEADLEFR